LKVTVADDLLPLISAINSKPGHSTSADLKDVAADAFALQQ
jgi:hypothetical protein